MLHLFIQQIPQKIKTSWSTGIFQKYPVNTPSIEDQNAPYTMLHKLRCHVPIYFTTVSVLMDAEIYVSPDAQGQYIISRKVNAAEAAVSIAYIA